MTDIAAASPPAPPVPPAAAAAPSIPWLGLTAVLIGTFISTLNGRLSSFGLTDIRGAIHAGFDEGAWITTAQTMAQMMVAPFAVWIGSIYGPRRILLVSSLGFAAIETLLPFSQNLPTLLVLQFLGGLASGTFVPLTLSFILRNMPLKLWAYGIGIYALNLEFSLNISASLEGWYVDHLSWHWIFWQNVPLALAMAACLHFGVPSGAPPPARINTDFYGLTSCALGLALIYAALDQGNRLDWTSSGLVWGLILAGLVMLVFFLIHELTTPTPWLDLRAAVAMPLPLLLCQLAILRLAILSTAALIPQYLTGVRGFRALQVGDTLLWIAAPQLVICPFAAFMLRRSDPRIAASLGFALVMAACMQVAYSATPQWGSDQFLVSQLMQAVGQSFALSGVVFISVLNLRPQDALTFGAMLQAARLMGGEIGTAFIGTISRIREQHASNTIGLHLRIGDFDVEQRLRAYTALVTRAGHQAIAGPSLLGAVVRRAATLQGVIDAFYAVGVLTTLGFIVLVLLPPPPRTPASHVPLFHRGPGL